MREHVFGLKSYLFSKEVQFNFTSDKFEENRTLVEKLLNDFLNGLEDNTVYKCMLVGITDDGRLISPGGGAFFISKHTRVNYITMKMKNTMIESTNKYLSEDFVN